MGYHRAGFEVVGVDINTQKNYPFEFHQADALTYPLEGFDAYHASPPCQAYSRLRHLPWLKHKNYPALIEDTRNILVATGKPWVIENVADAPLGQEYGYIMLCGWSLAELPIYRHRLFESNVAMLAPSHRPHPEIIYHGGKLGSRYSQANMVCGAFGYTKKVSRSYGTFVSVVGHDGTRNFPKAKEAMGIDWMTKGELTQAIPPAYTEYIGQFLMQALTAGDYSLREG
uniref:Putative methyltransferase n=1 Tax=viral metagenome TaxID=1070528 RepID=A0A6M3KL99_9ZZZZ